MKIVFRVDASLEMGAGHVMRCLTLSDALKRLGHECTFISRHQPGELTELIKQRQHAIYTLPECAESTNQTLAHSNWLKGGQKRDVEQSADALQRIQPDWLVVDHYGIDQIWERSARQYVCHILVIDDLADREHDCDILLDQNLDRSEEAYQSLLPENCVILTGRHYALLRPEFADYRELSLEYRKGTTQIDRVLITMGGVDKDNYTEKALRALELSDLGDNTQVKVVLGQKAPWLTQIKQQAANSRLNVDVLSSVANMAELMSQSDLAVGAAGSTSWERCCLGLPTIMCVLADNQQFIAEALVQYGAAIIASDSVEEISSQINNLSQAPGLLQKMSEQAALLVDGKGAHRVVNEMGMLV